MRTQKQRFLGILLTAFVLMMLGTSANASAASKTASKSSTKSTSSSSQTTTNDLSSTLPQTYNADKSVQIGMLVELKAKDPTTVVPVPDSDVKSMLGVVIPANNAALTLTPATIQQQQVLVATSGHYNVLISNQGGPIKVGDYLTLSSIDGVAMKASADQEEVIGKAAADFKGNANVIGSVALKDSLGKKISVSLGRIPVDIVIAHNPLFQKSTDNVPGFLAKAAQVVAAKPVSAARIYLGLVILFIAAIITGNMLYSGVRSGMLAVGRNPLSKKSIIKSLIQTVIAGLIVFIVGVFLVYLLLKL